MCYILFSGKSFRISKVFSDRDPQQRILLLTKSHVLFQLPNEYLQNELLMIICKIYQPVQIDLLPAYACLLQEFSVCCILRRLIRLDFTADKIKESCVRLLFALAKKDSILIPAKDNDAIHMLKRIIHSI